MLCTLQKKLSLKKKRENIERHHNHLLTLGKIYLEENLIKQNQKKILHQNQ